jgi:DNA polymerase-3 subunit alpha
MSLRSLEKNTQSSSFLYSKQFYLYESIGQRGLGQSGLVKKSEPRIQFTLVQYLQDVLDDFAKKLIVLLNISDLDPEFIHKLASFFENKEII